MEQKKEIGITGVTGLVGKALLQECLNRGWSCYGVGRKSKIVLGVPVFTLQDLEAQQERLRNTQCVIHLAGAGIADRKWSKSYKKTIIQSRTETIQDYLDLLNLAGAKLDVLVTASGIGYYGNKPIQSEILNEGSERGKDFLGEVCAQWEQASTNHPITKQRTVVLRTGVVLSKTGGFLGRLVPLSRYFLLSPLGNGKQVINWIHIDDLVQAYVTAIENPKWEGPYNLTNPNFVTNKEFTRMLNKTMGRPNWLPAVPAFIIRWMLGEMSTLLLDGPPVVSNRVTPEFFKFQNVQGALVDVLK